MYWAASLAVQEANAHGGCGGIPFKLIARWSENPWGSGVAQLARLVYEQQPIAVLGSIDSASTHLAEQVVAKANLPLVSPVATDKTTTLAGVSWMFSCAPSDTAVARALVNALLASTASSANVRSSRLVLITATDHESRMLSREVLREFSQRNRLPDYRHEVPPGAEFEAQIRAIVEAQVSAVVVVAGAADSARLVCGLQEQLPGVTIFGGPAMARSQFLRLAGTFAERPVFPMVSAFENDSPRLADFVGQFAAETGREPDYTAALTYDATRLLLEAVQSAGPSRPGVRRALVDASGWSGCAGTIAFDGTGQNTRTNVSMAHWRSGRITPLRDSDSLARTAQPTPPTQ
jgi:ABC-type branched-subunit amino acid transport system substrate-binding protein